MRAQDLVTLIGSSIDDQFLEKLSDWSQEEVYKAVALYQERTKTLVELADTILALHHGPTEYVEADIATHTNQDTIALLDTLIQLIQTHELSELHDAIKNFCKERAIKLVAVAQPIRIALTGCTTSPGVFDLLVLLGKDQSITRLKALQQKICI